jgi:hypothetical protein
MADQLPVAARLLLGTVLSVLAVGCGAGPKGNPPEVPLPAVMPNVLEGRNSLLVIGDSLSVGTAPLLPLLLPNWQVRTDGLGGRPLAEGIRILSVTQLPPDGSTVLAFSLFTNDDPDHTSDLAAAVRASVRAAGPQGCVVWATIARPRWRRGTYAAANALLHRMAAAYPGMRVVPWAETVAAHPILLGPDRIHPTPPGYQVRARLYAAAIRSCGPGGY